MTMTEFDPRPGGRFRFDMVSPEGSPGTTAGTFVEVVPNERLVFEMTEHCNGDLPPGETPQVETTRVTVEFRQDREGTTLRLLHRGFAPDVASERFREGWTSSLECLARVVEAPNPLPDRERERVS